MECIYFYKVILIDCFMLSREQALEMTPLDLVNVIDFSEGEMWRMNHDVNAHGRMTAKDIASPVADHEGQRTLAYKVLAEKTGIGSPKEMREYARDELRAQNRRWDDDWALIHNEGAVFTIGEKREYNWEVLGAYVARKGNCSYKELVVARIQGRDNIMYFDDRKVPEMERVSVLPIYQDVSPAKRRLIKVDEYLERRPRDDVVQAHGGPFKEWGDFNFAATFIHSGFGKFNTMNSYNSAEDDRESDNEIVLARPMLGQRYWVEFREADLVDMELVRN